MTTPVNPNGVPAKNPSVANLPKNAPRIPLGCTDHVNEDGDEYSVCVEPWTDTVTVGQNSANAPAAVEIPDNPYEADSVEISSNEEQIAEATTEEPAAESPAEEPAAEAPAADIEESVAGPTPQGQVILGNPQYDWDGNWDAFKSKAQQIINDAYFRGDLTGPGAVQITYDPMHQEVQIASQNPYVLDQLMAYGQYYGVHVVAE